MGIDKKFWWFLPYDDPMTGKHFNFEWEARVAERIKGKGCPYLSGNAVWIGFNDLASNYPELAVEWHPTKNEDLKPTDITKCSKKEVWWYKSYDDPQTGKHFVFEWKVAVVNRVTQKLGCPYLSGHAAWIGFNDLSTTHPELAKEWHPTKNGNLKPTDITAGSSKTIWWFLPYDDPKTGKHFDFEWKASPNDRTRGNGCPYLSNKAVWAGFNDLATTNPELAKEWHPTKNGNLKPTDVTTCSGKKVWWKILHTDLDTGECNEYEWKAQISNRKNGSGCPYTDKWKTQALIHNILFENGIPTKAEYSFPECGDKKPFPFDYAVDSNFIQGQKMLIEIDGIQHFKPIDFFGGEDEYKIRCIHDTTKDEFCIKKGIKLLRLPYIYDYRKEFDTIKTIILNFINHGRIPKKIKNFYIKREKLSYVKLIEQMEG